MYSAEGECVSYDGQQTILEEIENICSNYKNYKDIQRKIELNEQLANFNTYIEL